MNQSINDYIENKQKRLLHPWKYCGENGTSGYIWNDVLVSDEFIHEQYPVGNPSFSSNIRNRKGDNPDTTSLA